MKAHGKIPTWRWILFGTFFILFPIVFKPWWLAVASFAVFWLFMIVLYPNKSQSE
jgi:hypothetical protein